MSKRIGPKMLQCQAFVALHPGCVARQAAHYVNPHPTPSRNEALGYNIVHRTIAAGLIRCESRGGRMFLFPVEVS